MDSVKSKIVSAVGVSNLSAEDRADLDRLSYSIQNTALYYCAFVRARQIDLLCNKLAGISQCPIVLVLDVVRAVSLIPSAAASLQPYCNDMLRACMNLMADRNSGNGPRRVACELSSSLIALVCDKRKLFSEAQVGGSLVYKATTSSCGAAVSSPSASRTDTSPTATASARTGRSSEVLAC